MPRLPKLIAGILVYVMNSAIAQDTPPPTLPTEYAFTIEAAITAAISMGESVDGTRRSIPITGGSVHGKDIEGEVLAGGADYQVTRSDGTTMLSAVYMIKTNDGALINVVNEGFIVPPNTRNNAAQYFRTAPRFTAPKGKYGWLNNTVFVCGIRFRPQKPGFVIIDVYKVL